MEQPITFKGERLSHSVRKLGHEQATIKIDGKNYPVGLLCGVTTLLPCPNNCEEDKGYYVTLDQREVPLAVAYQCYTCGNVAVLEYSEKEAPPQWERLFVVEVAKIERNRVESQQDKRLEQNIYENRILRDKPDRFAGCKTPEPEIDSEILKDTAFWEQPYHVKIIGEKLSLQVYKKKNDYVNPGTILHVIVNNRYLLLGIQLNEEMLIYYCRDDMKDPESNEQYHKMIEYVQQLPKPIYFFDYDYKIFGNGMNEQDYILIDHITGIVDITAYGLANWKEELKKELGPKHFLARNYEEEGEPKDFEKLFELTIQGFELLLVIKRRIVDEEIKQPQKKVKEEEEGTYNKHYRSKRNRKRKYRNRHIKTDRQPQKRYGMRKFEAPVSKFRDIIRNAGNKPLGFDYAGEYYQISNVYGETDLIPCPRNCVYQRGFYAMVSPKTQFQPYIQIIYQCSNCDQMLIRAYDVAHMSQYTENEYKFIRSLINDVLKKRVKNETEYNTIRKKSDILAG